MFGYNRRPEPDPKRDHRLTSMELLVAAVDVVGSPVALAFETKHAAEEVLGARWHDVDERLRFYAAPKIAELWAFETGRLP